MSDRGIKFLLLLSVFIIATSGLIYELIASTLASYLLGDSVTQFSTVIGVYLFAMGIGSYLSKFITRDEVTVFVRVEILVGLVGGCSAAILFLCFAYVASFRVLLYSLVLLTGTLVGLEIPLLLRVLKDRLEFRELVSSVFTFDYIGALLAALLFPLVLVPRLGLIRSSFLFGIFNVLVALITVGLLRSLVRQPRVLASIALVSAAFLGVGFLASNKLTNWSESELFPDRVIYAESTPYQRIVLTHGRDDLRLYLNSNLQFSSRDEYRYHEALVHPGLARMSTAKDVLVMGGGDGLALREILRYPAVERVTLVDLDPAVTALFRNNSMLRELNADSLHSAKLTVVNEDAFAWLARAPGPYDFVVADFPDPSNYSLGKLYTTTFFQRLRAVLRPSGAFVAQCTSPWVARQSFWCVDRTLRAVGFQTIPYHCYVPSFGEWGFILASTNSLGDEWHFPTGLRFLNDSSLPDLFRFPPDMSRVDTEVNRLNNQALVRYFETEWSRYEH